MRCYLQGNSGVIMTIKLEGHWKKCLISGEMTKQLIINLFLREGNDRWPEHLAKYLCLVRWWPSRLVDQLKSNVETKTFSFLDYKQYWQYLQEFYEQVIVRPVVPHRLLNQQFWITYHTSILGSRYHLSKANEEKFSADNE